MVRYAALTVEFHDVVPSQTEAADWWHACKASMRAMPVVAMKEGVEFCVALI